MTGRKVKILALGGLAIGLLILGVGIWTLATPTSDEALYRAMRRDAQVWNTAYNLQYGSFGRLVRASDLARYYGHRFSERRSQLVHSGYLTNITIVLPKGVEVSSGLFKRINWASSDVDYLIAEPSWDTNFLMITCRQREDEDRLRKALARM